MSVFRVGSNKSSVNNFPSVRPTLDLDFANSKTLDPRITFTRASGGSYVGADGLIKYSGVNEARFDHDPVTGESLGLLVEESRTNLLVRSEEFDSGSWTKSNATVTSNAITAPDGTLTADKLIENTDNSTHLVYAGSLALTAGQSYVISVYVKAAERTFASIGSVTSGSGIGINLSTGTFVNVNVPGWGNATTRSVTSIGNGWYRVTITIPSATGSNSLFDSIRIFTNNGTTTTYTGDGTSGIFVWGAQLEVGAFPTSYIPTVASTRTRAADSARITGKNFSEWYRQDEGSIFINFKGKSQDTTTFERVYDININSVVNVETLQLVYNVGYNPDRIGYFVATNGVFIQDTTGTTGGFVLASSNPVKTAMCYKTAGYAYVFNGGTVITGFATRVPTVNTLDIGRVGAGGFYNGTISQLTYYPKRLPNAQLQALTK